jgi:UDP:flavonoid glycosyltransferase YjiC (YdhE family)
MKILMGWELGAGLGHVNRLKVIADRLRDDGAEITITLQDLGRAQIFTDAGYNVIQGPLWPMPTNPEARKIPTHNFADVLKIIGLQAEEALHARVAAWQALLAITAADLVIGDFAPALNLASRGRLPMVSVGNGYMTPPPGRRMPPIRPWTKEAELPANSRQVETDLLAVVNRVAAAKQTREVAFLADIFNGERSFVVTAAEVDPYRAYRTEPVSMPFNMPTGIVPRPLDQRRRKGVFLYLPRRHPLAAKIVNGLKMSSLDCDAYISDLPSGGVESLQSDTFKVHRTPLSFADVLPAVRLVVHHAGLSTAIAAAKAGTPQLIAPWNLEHAVTARGIIDAVGGDFILDTWEPAQISAKAQRLVASETAQRQAAAGASLFPDQDPTPTLDAIAAACKALAG